MKTCTITFFLLAATLNQLMSANLYIDNTQQTWKKHYGIISNCEIEVTPQNTHAMVEVTFTINVDSINYYKDNGYYYYGEMPKYYDKFLEAHLKFTLPEKAFIHDSYLWLNDSIIIRADILGSQAATKIYNGIVVRKTDPSLLKKVNATEYTLNVFPIITTYPRKVKFIYSIPIDNEPMIGDIIPIQMDLIDLLSPSDKIKFKFNQNNDFQFKSILYPIKDILISQNMNSRSSEVKVSEFLKTKTLSIIIESSNKTPFSLFYQKVDATHGFYDMKLNVHQLPNFEKKTTLFMLHLPFVGNGDKSNEVLSNYTISKDEILYETGKYIGNLDLNDSFEFEYRTNSEFVKLKYPMSMAMSNEFIPQNWANRMSNINPTNIDNINICMENRVLSIGTAFLALETGDTVKTTSPKSNNGAGGFVNSIEEIDNNIIEYKVYPNPVSDYFEIESNEEIVSIKLMNTAGSIVLEKIFENKSKKQRIDLNKNEIAQGMYLIHIQTRNGVKVLKIEIN